MALTHGHEVGWAALPGARQLLRRIARGDDVMTYLGEYTRGPAGPGAAAALTELQRLAPGVDVDAFHPGVDGAPVRRRLGLADRPVVVCVSRLVPRKGQDMLIRALPAVRRRVPDAALLLVGGGPYRADAGAAGPRARAWPTDVVFTGSVPWAELPAHYAAGDVFAMPCRTRRGGLDVEGLGIVYLEASATGLPVVAGDSGGAPDAVRDGETGYVVGGRDLPAVADRVATLLADPALARRMGAAGRAWAEAEWRWETQADRLRALLAPAAAWSAGRLPDGAGGRSAGPGRAGLPAPPGRSIPATSAVTFAAVQGVRRGEEVRVPAPPAPDGLAGFGGRRLLGGAAGSASPLTGGAGRAAESPAETSPAAACRDGTRSWPAETPRARPGALRAPI